MLINASPDIRQQILAFPALQPARAKRDTGIRAVLLIDSQIDHATGLLMLRENQQPLEVYCSQMVRQDLTTGFPVLRMLEHYCVVNWNEVPIDGGAFEIAGIEGLAFTALALSSKAPDNPAPMAAPSKGFSIEIMKSMNGG